MRRSLRPTWEREDLLLLLLEIIDLYVSYGKASILQGISLSLEDKELVSIIGPNGAGKTTLMRSIFGFTVRKGSIKYHDKNIEHLPTHKIVEKGISLCPERRGLFPEMTTLRNLQMGAYLRKNKKDVQRDLDKIFTLFPSLKGRKKNLAATLSGGEQQMLAVARALMSNPKLLMLDEPSFGLAPLIKKLLIDIFQEIQKEGISLFLAEQDALLALEAADRSYVLENGKIATEGKKENLIANPHVREAYLGLA